MCIRDSGLCVRAACVYARPVCTRGLCVRAACVYARPVCTRGLCVRAACVRGFVCGCVARLFGVTSEVGRAAAREVGGVAGDAPGTPRLKRDFGYGLFFW